MYVRHRLNQLAVKQHGLITLDQAFDAGLTVGQLRRRARSGEWSVVRSRVYAVAGAPPNRTQAIAAAALSLQPGAWVSHLTAADLWGFPVAECVGIDVLVALDRRVKLAGVCSHRSSALFTADLTAYLRIPVTSVERTLVDVSGLVPFSLLERMLDDGLRRRLVRLERLRRCVGRLAGSPGRRPAAIHHLLADRLPGYGPGDSDLETRALRLLVAHGIPLPVQQHRVRLGGRVFRVDLAYPAVGLAIELDGWEFHHTRSAFDQDRSRANALVAAGWTLVRFTSRTTDAEMLRTVRSALERCGRSGVA